ncbi:TPA: MTAP family purine nucleoside phosphorylase [Candidatus Woesearchaeota archaeon]|nr:MTAP family purine nucleoside phosphorylase [Candidatus Woesearchaeota archaeon]HII69519.1 MTAP family purine nucleoside phosphorylase [Candidatus Woesearchaeota archaeon]
MVIGIIVGSGQMRASFLSGLPSQVIEAGCTHVMFLRAEKGVFIQRHGSLDLPPHRINHAAHMQAFLKLGVKMVVGINSTGSLKRGIAPGSLLIPSDYLNFCSPATIFEDRRQHIVPKLSDEVISLLRVACRRAGAAFHDNGIYAQTQGPRLETKAEIAMLAQFADVVGMTMASEATIAQESGLVYASLCSVDNYCNGIADAPISVEQIGEYAGRNIEKVMSVIRQILR